jgi:hypothetical protein
MIVTWLLGGAVMAGGGWIFHHFLGDGTRKSKAQVAALQARLDQGE